MGLGRADVAAGPVADEPGTLPADIQHTADAPGRCGAGGQAGIGRWRRAADMDSIWRSNDAAEISKENSHRGAETQREQWEFSGYVYLSLCLCASVANITGLDCETSM